MWIFSFSPIITFEALILKKAIHALRSGRYLPFQEICIRGIFHSSRLVANLLFIV